MEESIILLNHGLTPFRHFLDHRKTRKGVERIFERGGGDGEALPSGIWYSTISENMWPREFV